MHVTKLILISLNLSTQKTRETKKNYLSSTSNDWNKNGKNSLFYSAVSNASASQNMYVYVCICEQKTKIPYQYLCQFSGRATLTNKVSGARDEANFNFIELVYQKHVGNKQERMRWTSHCSGLEYI